MAEPYRSYTPAEKRERRRLVARGGWQTRGLGQYEAGDERVDSRITNRIDAIDKSAEERGRRDQAAMQRRLDAARSAESDARTGVRLARGDDRKAARQAAAEAERRLREVEREARRVGL